MDKLNHKEYDIGTKLTQRSVIERFKAYVRWQRGGGQAAARGSFPSYGPVSINLDLTASCNFACPHCVDSAIINRRSRRARPRPSGRSPATISRP